MGGVLVLLVCLARARAEAPAVPPAVVSGTDAPATPTAEARLGEATAAYLQGDAVRARAMLQTLLADGPALPAAVRREALAYLGDILHSEQGPEASRSVFEALLREAPEYRMDPYVHPPAVCAWVEVLRGEARARSVASVARPLPPDGPPASQAREASTAVALPRTFPVAALVPGGVHLFRAGRPWAGATLASVQLGGLAVSVVTRARIDDAFATRSDDPDTVARWVWINRGAATAAWLAWGVPAVVELAQWSGTAGGTRIGAGPSGVRVEGTF